MKQYYFLLFVLFLGVACEPNLPSEEVESSLPGDTIIIYSRSGGFAGLQQEWTIYPDGRIILSDGSQKQIDEGRVQELFAGVMAADFQSLSASYMPEDTCCDLFTYTITVQTDGEAQTVTTMDEANEPAVLTAVRQTIDELIQVGK